MDLLGDLGGDPFSAPAQATQPPAGGRFYRQNVKILYKGVMYREIISQP